MLTLWPLRKLTEAQFMQNNSPPTNTRSSTIAPIDDDLLARTVQHRTLCQRNVGRNPSHCNAAISSQDDDDDVKYCGNHYISYVAFSKGYPRVRSVGGINTDGRGGSIPMVGRGRIVELLRYVK